jgi:hypothetical protein
MKVYRPVGSLRAQLAKNLIETRLSEERIRDR